MRLQLTNVPTFWIATLVVCLSIESGLATTPDERRPFGPSTALTKPVQPAASAEGAAGGQSSPSSEKATVPTKVESPPEEPTVSPTTADQTATQTAETAISPDQPPGQLPKLPDRPADKTTSGLPASRTTSPYVETRLDTVFLRDSDGELVPVLNMSYEDFERLMRLDRDLDQPDRPPSYSIERIMIEGAVAGERAMLTIRFDVQQLMDGEVRVPLRLNGVIPTAPAEYQGDGNHVLDSTGAKGGIVSWLSGSANDQHVIRMKVIVPVTVVGTESRLRLALPRSSTSELRLTIPGDRSTATVSPDAKILSRDLMAEDQMKYRVVGLGDEFQMAWNAGGGKAEATPLLLEAVGDLDVLVKGPDVLSTTATFRLTSFGLPMTAVRIKLPHGSKPLNVENAKFSIEYVIPEGDSGGQRQSPTAVVKFSEPTRGPVDVQLAVEHTAAAVVNDTGDQQIGTNVLGFEVIDAVRHHGRVDLMADGDWLVRWDELRDVRRINEPTDSLPPSRWIAAFEYYGQPAQLPIRVYSKETRINVTPTYVLNLEEQYVQLDALLEMRVRGAPVSFLQMDLKGWEVVDISESTLIAEEDLRLSHVTPLEIPFQSPRQGDFKLKVTARRDLPKEDLSSIQLALPSFPKAMTTHATVVVNPIDSYSITGNVDDMVAFEPTPLPDSIVLPVRERPPLCYRYQGDLRHAVLSYDIRQTERSVAVNVVDRVSVSDSVANVDQLMSFQVKYQPLDRIDIWVPTSVARLPSLRVFLDGNDLNIGELTAKSPVDSESTDSGGQSAESGGVRWSIPLPQPKLGMVEVAFRYDLDASTVPASEQGKTWALPFLIPQTGNLERAELFAYADASHTLSSAETGDWTVIHNSAAVENPRQELHAETVSSIHPAAIQLTLEPISEERAQQIVIERAFVQTWLTPSERQDRATLLLSMVSPRFRVQLPDGAVPEKVQALVNGRPADLQIEAPNRLLIDNPVPQEQVQLELFYPFATRPPRGEMKFELPLIEDAPWMRRVYWQLVTPSNEHLIGPPSDYTSENVWQWQDLAFRRHPRFQQAAMEDWSGASSQQPPAANCNVYLYSGFGNRHDLRVTTASRSFLLAVCSGTVFFVMAIGMVLPQGVRSGMGLVIVFALAAVSWVHLSLAILLCQGAALGVVLVCVSRLLRWLMRRPQIGVSDHPSAAMVAPAPLARGSSVSPSSSDASQLMMSMPEP